MTKPTRVFISSTWQDLRPEREAVERALHRMRDADFNGMEYFGSRPETPRAASLEEVDRSDIYVGIFGQRYGSGITEAEYRRARERGLPCLIYLKDERVGVTDEQREPDPAALERLRALKQELSAGHIVGFFEGPAELAAGVTADLHNLLARAWADRQPAPARAGRRHNLPAPIDSFVGRTAELARLKQLLVGSRLTTLTGAGGAGKTRLALEAARELVDGYRDGVWLVELAALQEPSLVPQAVAAALDVREEPGRPLRETLLEYLQPRQLLLLLDNCEHLLRACGELANDLLRGCPELRILATSRAVLDIAGEVVWRVPSLTLPDPPPPPSRPEQLSHFEATRLFIERAASRTADFSVTNQNAPAVAQVCLRLDGIPLAIELAAARVRSLSVEQIEARLGDQFRLLTGGSRLLPRHQTLRATMDWSHALLSAPEQVLFRRLAVFAGGCTLEAAEAIGGGDGIEQPDVIDLIDQLVDKSLLLGEEERAETRYRLLEPVRQYGLEQLEAAAEGDETRRRHAEWYLGLAEAAEPELYGRQQLSWLARLEVEHDNLRAALAWSQARPLDTAVGLRLAGALATFWLVRGYFTEGRQRLTTALAADGRPGATKGRVRVLYGAGALASRQADSMTARALLQQGVALGRELNDQAGLAASLRELGLLAWMEGDFDGANALAKESLGIEQALENRKGLGYAHDLLGMIAIDRGEFDLAGAHVQASLTLAEELGDRHGIAWSLTDLGQIDSYQGNLAATRRRFEASLALAREVDNKQLTGYTLTNLGLLGLDEAGEGRVQAHLHESLTLFEEIGDRAGTALALEVGAMLVASRSHAEPALRLVGAAAALRTAIRRPQSPVWRARCECRLAAARQALEATTALAAWEAGRAMPLEQAVAYGLGLISVRSSAWSPPA